MTFYPDMGKKSMVAKGDHVRAVGWLHPEHAYSQGEVPIEFLQRLREFTRLWWPSGDVLGWAAAGGVHCCEFCRKSHAGSEFGVPYGDLLFIAPEMIVHYVEQHRYAPPEEFVAAVLQSPLPDKQEFRDMLKRFKKN